MNTAKSLMSLFQKYVQESDVSIRTALTGEMAEVIELCNQVMRGEASWNVENPSCGIPSQIAGELATKVSEEMAVSSDNEELDRIMKHLDKNSQEIVQYMALVGACVVRPVFSSGRVQYQTVPLGNYIPTSYDFDGTLTGAIILKKIQDGKDQFVLAEEHRYTETGHEVESKLYKLENGTLKKRSLTDCEQTKDITPQFTWSGVKMPFIVEFRNNGINKIDGSNVPVALIAPALDLIKHADEQYGRMNWEHEAGQKRVFADISMFGTIQGKNNERQFVKTDKTLNKLMVKLIGDGSDDMSKIKEYSPELRTQAQSDMLQQIFRRIELTCNLGKGTISDLQTAQQTATQYMGGKESFYAIVNAYETELEEKYKQCAEVFAYMLSAYNLAPYNAEITITYDDSGRKDPTLMRQMAMQEISAGIRDKWEYRNQFLGEDEETAKSKVPVVENLNPFGV